MSATDIRLSLNRLRWVASAENLTQAAIALRTSLKFNPNWHLQPRVPAGFLEGGQWVAYLIGAAGPLLPLIRELGAAAARRLRQEGGRLAPVLRRLPKLWDQDSFFPPDDDFEEETRRISSSSWQRFGYPTIRFRSEDELRRYLGPAGPGREWHHIVEKRLAGREGFPAEVIHSTDNVISLPIAVHRRVSARMSMREHAFERNVRRFWLETRSFQEQYNHGLDLVEETLKEFGYDPSDF